MRMESLTPAWTDAGPPQATQAVVFLHGIGGGRTGWAEAQAHLAQAGWRSLAWDMPGYGESPMLPSYDFANLARALVQMLDAARVVQAVLVGHSMGAMVALQTWTQAPERISGVLLAATSPAFGHAGGDFQQQFLAQRLSPLDQGQSMAEVAERVVPTLVAPTCPAARWAPARDSMSCVNPQTYRAALHALVQFDQRAALPTLTVPVLCLAAEHDRAAPAAVMARMAEKIPHARSVCVPEAGHLLHLEQPDTLLAELDLFLKSVKA